MSYGLSAAEAAYRDAAKAPTLTRAAKRAAEYGVQPHEVRAHREVAPESDGPEAIHLTPAEAKAAGIVARQVHANADVKVQQIIAAINHVRNNDPVGTLRKNSKGQYAFSYDPGKWLLIDVDKPAYRAEELPGQNVAIRESWELVARG